MLSARLYDTGLRRVERQQLGAWRKELLADVSGGVLEIGAGTGTPAVRTRRATPDPARA